MKANQRIFLTVGLTALALISILSIQDFEVSEQSNLSEEYSPDSGPDTTFPGSSKTEYKL